MDIDEYSETVVNIIKKFDKIAPYIKYSGRNEMEFSFLIEDIYRNEKTYNKKLCELTEEDIQYVNYLIDSSKGMLERDETEKFIKVLYTYAILGKDKCLKKFDVLAYKLIHNNPVMATT